MKICFHKNFDKQYKKLTQQQKTRTKKRLGFFLKNPYNEKLSNHALRGKYLDYRSINITGDIRAIYKYINEQKCIFVAIVKHSQLKSK